MKQIFANASDESIGRYNLYRGIGEIGAIFSAVLASELEFIKVADFGFQKNDVPDVLRNQGTDFVNAFMWLGFYNVICQTVLYVFTYDREEKRNQKLPAWGEGKFSSLVLPALAILTIAAGAKVEWSQSAARHTPFDWPDMVAYTLGYGTYILAHHAIRARAAKVLKPA